MNLLTILSTILPEPPTGTPEEIAKNGLDFFELWIGRVGGFVAFIGAIKFGLAVKEESSREQLQAVLIMVSGFMIKSAVKGMGLFSPSPTSATTEFVAIMNFIEKWTRRVGVLGMLIGAVMFGLATRESNANSKVSALKTISAGAIVASVSALLPTMV